MKSKLAIVAVIKHVDMGYALILPRECLKLRLSCKQSFMTLVAYRCCTQESAATLLRRFGEP